MHDGTVRARLTWQTNSGTRHRLRLYETAEGHPRLLREERPPGTTEWRERRDLPLARASYAGAAWAGDNDDEDDTDQ